MSLENMKVGAGIGALYCVGAVIGSGVCSLASKVHSLPLLKGSLSVGIVGGISNMVGVVSYGDEEPSSVGIVGGISNMVGVVSYGDEEPSARDVLSRVIAGFALTVFASPTLSKYISKSSINYLQSMAITTIGMSTSLGLFAGGLLIHEAVTSES